MSLEEKIKHNVWDTNLAEVFETILEQSKEGNHKWRWFRNCDCKYIGLSIDMRDGGFILSDRDGKRITLEQLKRQAGENSSEESES